MQSFKARLGPIATYLPEKRLSNEQLNQEFPDWAVDKIFNKTGIAVRGLADIGETAADLGIAAANKLFDRAECRRDEVDFLLFCTQSPDYYLPTTACVMQAKLELPTTCGALDFNLGCSGFVYGLSLAKGLIESGAAKKVLLITSETYSKYIHTNDRGVRTIFSDGAAATIVESVESDSDLIGPFVFGTDGRGAAELVVPAGGHRLPSSEKTKHEKPGADGIFRSAENLFMNGPEIFNFTLKAVPQSINALLAKAGTTLEDIDFVVPHQANKFMLEQLRKKMGIPTEKFCINLEKYGNTVSSTIPMALEIAMKEGRITSGMTLLLSGFGVGYSWAACQIKTQSTIQER